MAGAWQRWEARAREYVVGGPGARKRRRRLVDHPLRAPGRGSFGCCEVPRQSGRHLARSRLKALK